jgi:hypothetical protein
MSLVIFSHSDYSYLWPIIQDITVDLFKLNPIFIFNSENNIVPPSGFEKYIKYDSTLCFAERWLKVLPEIESDYILVVHDVCLIINADITKLEQLFNIVKNNNIDRCCLNVFDGDDVIAGDIPLCNLSSATTKSKTYIPYDVSPSIWKKQSFLNLWTMFPNETYANSEQNHALKNYCKTNLACFGLQKTNEKIYYCVGRPYYDFFNILHITIKGEVMFPYEVYMDNINKFHEFFVKYDLEKRVRVNENYGFVLTNFNKL